LREHSLALDASVHAPDLDLVHETAPHYRLKAAEADEIVAEVRDAVAGWRAEAEAVALPADEIELMGTVFGSS
jgi:hypothetical protein